MFIYFASKTTEASGSQVLLLYSIDLVHLHIALFQKQISDDLTTTELLPEQPATVATLHIESRDSIIVRDTPSQPLLDLANRMQKWTYSPQIQSQYI